MGSIFFHECSSKGRPRSGFRCFLILTDARVGADLMNTYLTNVAASRLTHTVIVVAYYVKRRLFGIK